MSLRSDRARRRAQKRRNQRIVLILIGVLILSLIGYAAFRAFSGREDEGETITTASGLRYQDLEVGTGEEASVGDTVLVHYTGTLADGTQFDSSRDRGQPFQFILGSGGVIQGWEEGIQGMREGGKRLLVIPPDLAYGAQGRPPVIPSNAELTFDVELVEVNP